MDIHCTALKRNLFVHDLCSYTATCFVTSPTIHLHSTSDKSRLSSLLLPPRPNYVMCWFWGWEITWVSQPKPSLHYAIYCTWHCIYNSDRRLFWINLWPEICPGDVLLLHTVKEWTSFMFKLTSCFPSPGKPEKLLNTPFCCFVLCNKVFERKPRCLTDM